MTKEEAMELQPFDVVIGLERVNTGYKNIDLLVKRVSDNGVFCLSRIQSTAILYKFENIERQ